MNNLVGFKFIKTVYFLTLNVDTNSTILIILKCLRNYHFSLLPTKLAEWFTLLLRQTSHNDRHKTQKSKINAYKYRKLIIDELSRNDWELWGPGQIMPNRKSIANKCIAQPTIAQADVLKLLVIPILWEAKNLDFYIKYLDF